MKCPKCDGELKAKRIEDVEVDQCVKCSGIWFDFDELEQVLDKAVQEELKNKVENNEGDDDKRAACPKCGGAGKMINLVNPAHNIHIDKCTVCYGQWLDGGEYEKMKSKSIFDIFRF